MTKLYALTVGKNEADRYLESMLTQITKEVDALLYYDDQSTDDSLKITSKFPNVYTTVRPNHVPSFIEHEGRFRQDAWDMAQSVLPLTTRDWILAIDTDEVLTSTKVKCCLRCEINLAVDMANLQNVDSIILPIPEVFGIDTDETPLIRKDGLWGQIRGFRLFRYRPGGVYKDKSMACGAEPLYVENGKKSKSSLGLHLMHFGYADERDKIKKYDRYNNLLHGHNDNHIQSIMSTPTLVRWENSKVSLKRAT